MKIVSFLLCGFTAVSAFGFSPMSTELKQAKTSLVGRVVGKKPMVQHLTAADPSLVSEKYDFIDFENGCSPGLNFVNGLIVDFSSG